MRFCANYGVFPHIINIIQWPSNKSESDKEFEDLSKLFNLLESTIKKRHRSRSRPVLEMKMQALSLVAACRFCVIFLDSSLPILKKWHYWQIMGCVTEVIYKNAIVNLVWCATLNFGISKSILYVPAHKKL